MSSNIKGIALIAASFILAFPLKSYATTYTGNITLIRYGINQNRVSVQVTENHTGCGSANPDFYTFTSKPLWAAAFLEALENNLQVSITGTDKCTLGVEEIKFFDVLNASSPSARRK